MKSNHKIHNYLFTSRNIVVSKFKRIKFEHILLQLSIDIRIISDKIGEIPVITFLTVRDKKNTHINFNDRRIRSSLCIFIEYDRQTHRRDRRDEKKRKWKEDTKRIVHTICISYNQMYYE